LKYHHSDKAIYTRCGSELVEKTESEAELFLGHNAGRQCLERKFLFQHEKEQEYQMHFKTIDKVRQILFENIEIDYNRKQVQKRLRYLNPVQWLRQLQQKASNQIGGLANCLKKS
jgi:hypothetical protein